MAFELLVVVGVSEDGEVSNGVGFGRDVEAEGDFVWKL